MGSRLSSTRVTQTPCFIVALSGLGIWSDLALAIAPTTVVIAHVERAFFEASRFLRLATSTAHNAGPSLPERKKDRGRVPHVKRGRESVQSCGIR